jgi:molybdopterin molybdotransferase
VKSYRGFLRHVIASAPEPRTEIIAAAMAQRRVLARDVRARVNDPAEPRSAMDGYAVRARDLRGASPSRPVQLRATGVAPAGFAGRKKLVAGEAQRIMTGAPIPPGADTIVMVEKTRTVGTAVEFREATPRGTHVRYTGENFRRQTTLIKAGTVMRAQEIGLCITAGVPRVAVTRRLRVGVLATGDELVPPAPRLSRGQVFNSNGPMVMALVQETGAVPVDLGRVSDRPRDLIRRVAACRDKVDFLVTIGGVSAGDFDVVKQVIRDRGQVELVRIAMRPAKPQAFGRFGGLFWYGMPGNPVSAMVAFDRILRPLLLRAMGQRHIFRTPRSGICGSTLEKPARLREFVRAHATQVGDQWRVKKVGPSGSSNLRSMVNANAFVVLPEGCTRVEPGAAVDFELWSDPPNRARP